MMFFLGTAFGLGGGLIIAAYLIKREHRHSWTPWNRIFNEEKLVFTDVQERNCTGCGLHEKRDPALCPPHRWGKWEVFSLKKVDVNGNKSRDITISALKRDCAVCGLVEREEDF